MYPCHDALLCHRPMWQGSSDPGLKPLKTVIQQNKLNFPYCFIKQLNTLAQLYHRWAFKQITYLCICTHMHTHDPKCGHTPQCTCGGPRTGDQKTALAVGSLLLPWALGKEIRAAGSRGKPFSCLSEHPTAPPYCSDQCAPPHLPLIKATQIFFFMYSSLSCHCDILSIWWFYYFEKKFENCLLLVCVCRAHV